MKLIVNARFLTQKISGVQRYGLELSRQLKDIAPEIEFVAPKKIIHHETAQKLGARSIGWNRGHVWEQVDLPRYVRRKSNAILINLANTAPLRIKRKIITIHDIGFLRHPEWYSRKFYHFYKFLIPRLARSSLIIIVDSSFARNEIIDRLRVPSEKVKVVYCGLPQVFRNPPEAPANRKYGDYILMVSSLDPRKNMERSIRAFQRLDLPDLRLVIAGSHHQAFATPALERLIKDDRRIFLTGYVGDDELPGLYRQARLLVYPSLYEGFGLPPLEAMACGCPCVVSDTASLPEVCGRAALYCDPHDIDDIADKMMKMLVDTEMRNRFIERGRQQAQRFSWNKSAVSFMETLRNMPMS